MNYDLFFFIKVIIIQPARGVTLAEIHEILHVICYLDSIYSPDHLLPHIQLNIHSIKSAYKNMEYNIFLKWWIYYT